MRHQSNSETLTKRQRRTNNLALSFGNQVQKFLFYCNQKNLKQNTINTQQRHLDKLNSFLTQQGTTSILDISSEELQQYIFSMKNMENMVFNSLVLHK